MARCSCSGQTCGCVITAGDGVSLEGAGTAANPLVISAEGGGGGGGGWEPGDLKPVSYANTPAGWLEANGQAVSRSTYADLFTSIGTIYGAGNGSTTFNVPDYRDRALVGASGTKPLGSAGGSPDTTLLAANLPPHAHTINHNHAAVNTSAAGAHTHNVTAAGNSLEWDSNAFTAGTENGIVPEGNAGFVTAASAGSHAHTVDIPAFVGASGNGPGTAAPFSNQSPYRAIRVLVKT